jgi:menaquinone-dependent protoporphyrinogen oxidase
MGMVRSVHDDASMAQFLLLYGTSDGQTQKIAEFCGAQLRRRGCTTSVVNAAEASPNPAEYDAVIVAASVHASGYQRAVKRWCRRNREALGKTRTAFLSVCLGVLQHDVEVDKELGRIADRFFASTGFQPGEVKIVAGALPYTKYNFFKRFVMKRIVRKAGGDLDTSRDYEYTDWDDLRAFIDAFVLSTARRAARARTASAHRSR